jgi:hypothetical protein
MARLIRTDWSDFGTPDVAPAFSLTDALLIAGSECLLCTGRRLVGADWWAQTK